MSTWIGEADGSWFNAARWSGGVPDTSGTTAEFSFSSNLGVFTQVNAGAGATVGTVTVSLAGNARFQVLGLLTFNSGLAQIPAQLTIDSTSVGLPTSFEHLALVSDLNVNLVQSGVTAEFDGVVSGAGRIVKSGQGRLDLNFSANTFAGGIFLQEGRLYAAGDGALGSGAVTIANSANFVSSGSIDNMFATVAGAAGTAGNAHIVALTNTNMTLTGALHHLSQGTISFGSFGETGTIIAGFSSILDNATTSRYSIDPSITLRIGSAYVAANLFDLPGSGSTYVFGTLDASGFAVLISNLYLSAGGTIRSSAGSLNLTVNDTSVVVDTHFGTFQGTAGNDQIVINVLNDFDFSQVTFNLWTPGTDTITYNGSANANEIYGTAQRETFNGGGGNDLLVGNGGLDTFSGGSGNDLIVLNTNNDGSSVDGGADFDTLRVISGTVAIGSLAGIEAVNIQSGGILLISAARFASGLAVNTHLSGTGTLLIGMSPGDILLATSMTTGAGSDITFAISGSTGTDVIKSALAVTNNIGAGDSADQIRSGNLVDTIDGGAGNDKIMGLGGADQLTGGTGADQFRYLFTTDSGTGAGADQILDFVAGTDKMDFRVLDANAAVPGRQALNYVGTAAFANNGSAQVRWVDLGTDLRVEVDLDGNGTADMQMLLVGAGAQSLTATDFLL